MGKTLLLSCAAGLVRQKPGTEYLRHTGIREGTVKQHQADPTEARHSPRKRDISLAGAEHLEEVTVPLSPSQDLRFHPLCALLQG